MHEGRRTRGKTSAPPPGVLQAARRATQRKRSGRVTWTVYGAVIGATVALAGILGAMRTGSPAQFQCGIQMKDIAFLPPRFSAGSKGSLEMCACTNAPRSTRGRVFRSIAEEFERRPPDRPTDPVVLTDIGPGGLLQVTTHIDAALSAGHEKLVVNLIEPGFPREACGTYLVSAQADHIAFTASPARCAEGRSRSHANRRAFDDFLRYLHTQTRQDCRPATIEVQVYRSPQVYAAALRAGEAPAPNFLTLIDPPAPGPRTDPQNANLVVGRDELTPFAVWIPTHSSFDARTQFFRFGMGGQGALGKALMQLGASPSRDDVLAVVEGHAQHARYYDDPTLAYRDLLGAVGEPARSAFFLNDNRIERGVGHPLQSMRVFAAIARLAMETA